MKIVDVSTRCICPGSGEIKRPTLPRSLKTAGRQPAKSTRLGSTALLMEDTSLKSALRQHIQIDQSKANGNSNFRWTCRHCHTQYQGNLQRQLAHLLQATNRDIKTCTVITEDKKENLRPHSDKLGKPRAKRQRKGQCMRAGCPSCQDVAFSHS